MLADGRSRRELRRDAYALLGAVAESSTYVRQRVAADTIIYDVTTGMVGADTGFAPHGHRAADGGPPSGVTIGHCRPPRWGGYRSAEATPAVGAPGRLLGGRVGAWYRGDAAGPDDRLFRPWLTAIQVGCDNA